MTDSQPTLAIDYGTKRLGLAIARGPLAEPLTIIENKPDKSVKKLNSAGDTTTLPISQATVVSPAALQQIKQICDQEKVDQILIGLSENEMAAKTKAFGQALHQELDLPVHYFDETLSSQTVRQKITTSGMKKSKRQRPIDHYAAAEFLQEWLETS